MASAVLADRSELSWAKPRGIFAGGKMGKTGKTVKNRSSNFGGKRQLQDLATAGYEVNDESTQSASVDAASSVNRTPAEFSHPQYVSFDVSSRSRKELSDLKVRLVAELDQIRQLRYRIDSGKPSARFVSNAPPKKPASKKISGNKRPQPSNSSKDLKRSHNSEIGGNENSMKLCDLILTKLMKHKHAWVFKSPVDVIGEGLHDYYTVVKRPMDLGTVKANLRKNLYASPLDFAEDVKLTFKNSLLYNPKGHQIHDMAEQLLARFEELFLPMYEKFEDGQPRERVRNEELPASSWTNVEPERVKEDASIAVAKKSIPASSWTDAEPERVKKKKKKVEKKSEQTRLPPQPSQSPVGTPLEPTRAARVKPVKQPKPKAKDPNKREMNLEEKHRLGVGLQSLPQEKMEQVVQIISKRNGHLRHDGDEIELDIEAVDTETLWELDRLVTNWKKLASKIKRQALMNNNAGSGSGSIEQNGVERIDVGMEAKIPKKAEGGDEDVDIEDDMPISSYAPVEIEKDGGGGEGEGGGRASSSSSSSSSSGSDSSSSDSDSGSSSGSDSEADNAH